MDQLPNSPADPPPRHTVQGEVRLLGLPVHQGLLLALRRHSGRVPNPTGARIEDLVKDVHLQTDRTEPRRVFAFQFEWDEGDYLVEIRPILLRKDWKDRLIAQSEPKVFRELPLRLRAAQTGLVYEVTWPSIPLEELESYGVLHPDGRTERL